MAAEASIPGIKRIAFVSGAARGIGLAIAERLARDGCHVIMADLNAQSIGVSAQKLQAAGLSATPAVLDVRDRKADSFTRQLNDVDLASVLPAGEYNHPDAKTWKDLSGKRK